MSEVCDFEEKMNDLMFKAEDEYELDRLNNKIKESEGWVKIYLEKEKKDLIRKMKYPTRKYKLDLLKYFYEHQYDSENENNPRHSTFRACDFHNEYDMEGNQIPTYQFYN